MFFKEKIPKKKFPKKIFISNFFFKNTVVQKWGYMINLVALPESSSIDLYEDIYTSFWLISNIFLTKFGQTIGLNTAAQEDNIYCGHTLVTKFARSIIKIIC